MKSRKESIEKAQMAYPVRALSPVDFDTVMCISHANRKICNARLNEHEAVLAEAAGKQRGENGKEWKSFRKVHISIFILGLRGSVLIK